MSSSKLTPDSSLDLLFAPDLISAKVKAELPSELHIRPLASTDHTRNHLQVLSILTLAPQPSPSAYVAQFTQQRSCPNTYYTLVIVNKATDAIVGVGSLFIERKFLRGLGNVGHIEDIAVDKSMQGKKLGVRVIEALTSISENSGCYKTILNCSDDNIPFYKKCGYERKENEMAKYATPSKPQSPRL